ncbi:MAG: AAA family ATPase [Candidatus Moranbacteria bacterium]|nr:AAA family ATPase [Candidatus Moranbacteria bacterium]
MKIEKITVENYKSIKHLEIEPNPGLNAFIGENSVGKSNIFKAINWPIGPVYPSFNSTQDQDHWNGDRNNKITISLQYDDGKCLQLAESWEDYHGNEKSGLNLSGGYINSEEREKYCSACLDIEREIQDYLPSNRWTLIGRILQQINKEFLKEDMVGDDGVSKPKKEVFKDRLKKIRDDVLFSVGRSAVDKRDGLMDQFLKIIQKESAKQLNRSESDFSIDLKLYDPWNFYRTLQLLVDEIDMDKQFQASSLGMGVQASITIAVLKAYAALNLTHKTPIFIDEPELFLHPQAQRNFYNLLREMTEDKIDKKTGEIVEGLQIFYTTHSQNFLRTDKFDEIHILRKTKEIGTYCNEAKAHDFVIDLKERTGITSTDDEMALHFKNAYENTGDSQRANEAFFAKKIILVEGQSENLILPYFFDLYGFDYVKEGITIVRCGCKDEIDRFFRLYNEFGIPAYVIFDGDGQHKDTEFEQTTQNKNRAIADLFGIDSEWADGKAYERFFGFEKRLEDYLGFQTAEKGLRLFIQVKEKIKSKKELPAWVEKIIEKIQALNSPLPSVLKKPVEIASF